ncbi:hypothetical protein L1987_29044 [Smallanthus sonchifolius]|uniref:Uncharacterized protein n=1 Tax=Smallanthus sonchifolius TaxID=185202 RepID=A0ACB9HYY5_9ASTR|nr:hypothetical protein L1987_29044 [Smallanthus sonchifolius]
MDLDSYHLIVLPVFRFEALMFSVFVCHPAPLPGRVSLQFCLLDSDLIGVQKKSSDGQDSGDTKQSTADMTQFVQTLLQQMQNRFQTIISILDEMGDRINELEQSINDLRTEMGVEGSPSPLSTSKKPDEPKTEEGSA